MSHFLITGGAGFIGSHIAEKVLSEGDHSVRILDNLSSGHKKNVDVLKGKVEFIEGDIRDFDTVSKACEDVDFVFHEAALVSVTDSIERPHDNYTINIQGTLNVLESAARSSVKRVVLASSSAIYGDEPTLPKTEDLKPHPISPYGQAKAANEYFAAAYSNLYSLPVIALRYFNVYGPRQDSSSEYSGVISIFAECARQNRTPKIYGDGGHSRDFVFVRDVANLNYLAMTSPQLSGGEVFNVGTGRATTLLELLESLGAASGSDMKPEFHDDRPGDIRHSMSQITKAESVLGYAPQFSLDQGLKQLLDSLET